MEEKKQIGQLFDRIAGTYDKFNHVLSLNIDKSWRRRAVKDMKPCSEMLDVAIGTADLSIEALRQGKASSVVGIDLSEEMMKIGEKKVEAKGYAGKVVFEAGSALQMPYEADRFDAVTCGYGVRNFSDLDKGLSEMHRVMKPGGQLMILEFSYPSNPFVRFFYNLFFTYVMPLVGKAISKEKSAYKYFMKSVKDFIWGEEMLGHIRAAGFVDCSFKTLTFGITTIYRAQK